MNPPNLLLFVLFIFSFQIHFAHSGDNVICGIASNQVLTLKYQSTQQPKEMEIKISLYAKKPFKAIFDGFITESDNLTKKQCVVIKMYHKSDEKFYKNINLWEKLKKVDEKNEYFVNIIDYGEFYKSSTNETFFENENSMRGLFDKSKSGYLTILERGERDLQDEMNKNDQLSLEEIKTMIKDCLKALMAFHKVGIHLDFKPQNLIVVERMKKKVFEKKKIFKLIDFDGSVEYLEGQQKGKVPHNLLIYTERYSAPELLQNLSDAKKVYEKNNGKEVYVEYHSNWNKTPEIMLLVVNMLSIDPKKRMSAKGVIDYLEGKCKPKEYEKKPKKIEVFGDVPAEKLQKLKEKYYVYVYSALEKVEKKLAKDEESIQKFMKELVKRKDICEY